MNYKSFIPSRALRIKILKMMSFVPDSIMLKLQYRIKTGKKLNLKEPKRFTEKLQLYKMYYRNPLLPRCVDKYEVRGYIEESGLGHLLNELYGVYLRAQDIDFGKLPDRFVVKTTNGAGSNTILICRDKSKLDIPSAIRQINSWLGITTGDAGREWAYTEIKQTRIIVEEYLEDKEAPDSGIADYKFFCFNGEPQYLYVIPNRKPGEYAYLGIYDIGYNKLPAYRSDERKSEQPWPKPENYEQMVDIARKLSQGFPHVRVDLYNIGGRIYFGELTFYDGSGYGQYDPDEFDFTLGEKFDIASFCKPHRD